MRPTLLLVDDDEIVLETLRKLLQLVGFRVVSHSSGHAALAELEQRKDIAVLVSDFEMPGINGEQLARAAKQQRPTMPVYICSGHQPPDMQPTPWDEWFLKGGNITRLVRRLQVLTLALADSSAPRRHLQ